MDNLLFNGLQDWNGHGEAEWQFIRSVKNGLVRPAAFV
jgi:hypothetical protein